MKDQFGRDINYMRISVTDRCNLRCRYCMPNGVPFIPHSELLTYEEFICIIKQAVTLGIDRFKITGGEPLARRGCVDFIKRVKALPRVRQVTMTSNGLLLEQSLEELISAGLDGVNISLDTLDEAKYRQLTGCADVCLKPLLHTIRCCADAGLTTKINAVLLEENLDELPRLAALAADYPVDVRFIELVPIGCGSRLNAPTSEEALKILHRAFPDLTAVAERRGNGPARYFASASLKGRIGLIDAVSHRFCENCNRVRLTSIGRLKPCLCYHDAVDLRKPLRSGATEGDLRRLMSEAIFAKPRAHCFGEQSAVSESAAMNQIGG